MICRALFLALAIGATTAWAQSTTNSTAPSSGSVNGNTVISSGPAANSTALGGGNVTLTNQNGGTFTVTDLGRQLQNLKASVDQTMPLLTAFNARYSSANSASGGLAGALSGLLHRNGNQGQSQSSSELTNVLTALSSMLTTNSNTGSSVAFSATTLSDLQTLQRDLEATEPLLQSLAGNTSSGTSNQGHYGYQGNTNQAPLTPTGR